jgi:K+-transporting ATPase ATPase A chain
MGALYPVVLLALALATAWPLAAWMHRVYEGRLGVMGRVCGPAERFVYRVLRTDPGRETGALAYTRALLSFSLASLLVLYLMQRIQGVMPVNPDGLGAIAPDLAFNTAASFTTNTNWQSYIPEQTMAHLTQMAGLGVQNFASAAVGMAVAVALVRGFARSRSQTIGNFWADLIRGTMYVLVPLALVVGVLLALRGVVMTFGGTVTAATLDGQAQEIARGPAASQVAIKQIGTNGGGFFNANSAHPFENPTAFTNLVENWALLAIPLAFPLLYGRMVGRIREGFAILAAMLILVGAGIAVASVAEHASTPAVEAAGYQDAPNMEGKEQRFTIDEATTWSVTTTGTSTGSVNSLHSSYTAVAGGTQLFMMLLGEVAPGGVGAGLYGMLMFVVIAVFLGGLMIGRTPEILGKRIGAREVKLALLAVLVMPVGFLTFVAISVVTQAGLAGPLNAGPHGLTEILYAFASAWNNNGSAFAGISADTDYYNLMLGTAMLLGRFAVIVPVLALAGSLAAQTRRPAGPGTMPSASPVFVGLLVGTVVLVGALSFFPALVLGPVAEALTGGLS